MMRIRRFDAMTLRMLQQGILPSEHAIHRNTIQVRINERTVEPCILEEWDERLGWWVPVPIVVPR